MNKAIDHKKRDHIIRKAKTYTWESGFNSHCLCHGALGNAELYRETHDTGKTDQIVEQAIAIYKKEDIWLCGHSRDIAVPGLMCGLAGIGYGLLRHINPQDIPNILLLETLNIRVNQERAPI